MTRYPVSAPSRKIEGIDETLARALAGRAGISVVLIVGVVAFAACTFLALQHRFELAFVVFGIPTTAVILWSQLIAGPRRVKQELAWLATIPFPFAHQGYYQALSQRNEKVGFDLVLHFDRDVAKESLAASIEAAGLDQTPRPRGGNVFVVATPQFAARHENTTSTKSRTYYDTGPLHRWFKERGVPLLVSLVGEQGLTSVEIEL